MAFVFVILFFAAIFGIFRPYKFLQNSKRWHYGLATLISFIAIGVTAPDQPQISDQSSQKVNTTDADDPKEETGGAKQDKLPKSKWTYDTQKDEMRGKVGKYATLKSENTIKFEFPYGEQPGVLTIRQDPQFGLDAMFSVPSGQILCHGFGDSYVNVKFDEGAIRRFNCTSSSDGSSEVAFMSNPKQFISALKTAKRVVIEAEFYQAGRQQYIFETQSFIWEN
jgi:hypothetical protein